MRNTCKNGSTGSMCKLLCMMLVFVIANMMAPVQADAATAGQIDRDVDSALEKLYTKNPAAKVLAAGAKGVLVFPSIVKGGLIVGGQYGQGALRVKDKTEGYYSTAAVSYGLQVGVQSFGYALFFMTDSALEYFKKSEGWEFGTGPSIVIVDEGLASAMTTTTLKSDIYAYFFDQKGLMAGLGLQGTKITRITPDTK